MRTILISALLLVVTATLSAQVSVLAIDKLPMARGDWNAQRFSPDGTKLYLTTHSHDGIWEYQIPTRALRQITAERGVGYEFNVSPDGRKIAFRRQVRAQGRLVRHEVVTRDLKSGAARVVSSGKDLSAPQFSQKGVAYAAAGEKIVNASALGPDDVGVLGIENRRIVLQRNGKKVLLDPLGNGSYIWPSLSPDKTRILAHDMTIGTFVCDLEGKILARLGRCNAPVWTRDGRWVVYMNDTDDGHRLLSSDIYCVSADGTVRVRLTDMKEKMVMYPQCSPVDDRIVCSTPDGQVFVITYKEEGQ